MARKGELNFRLLIKQDKCDRCSSRDVPLCTEVCPHGAIYPDVNSNYIWVECDLSYNREFCHKCIDACPQQAIEIQKVPSAKVKQRTVLYFETPGIQNTKRVVDVIADRVADGDIKSVVAASCSGSSSLLLAKVLQAYSVKIVNISPSKEAQEKIGWQPIQKQMAQMLKRLGVICREKHCLDVKKFTSFPTEIPFYESTTGQQYKIEHLEKVFYETLIHVGGMGLKTAVECMFSACVYGDITAGENVISTAGSGWVLIRQR